MMQLSMKKSKQNMMDWVSSINISFRKITIEISAFILLEGVSEFLSSIWKDLLVGKHKRVKTIYSKNNSISCHWVYSNI